PEAVVAHDERGAGIELLVLQVAAGELGADQVPGELVELHALERAELRRLPVLLEELAQLAVVHHRAVGRHLEHAAADELAQRDVSGLSNSLGAWRSKGFLDHSVTPGALTGMAQVTDSCSWVGARGSRLPIQRSLANTAPVASIFMPVTTRPSSSSRTTLSEGTGRFCLT